MVQGVWHIGLGMAGAVLGLGRRGGDGGSAASPMTRAGWDGTSIRDPSLPEPSAKEAPPHGVNCGGREVSMGDDVGGAASPTARAGWGSSFIFGLSLPDTLSLLGV